MEKEVVEDDVSIPSVFLDSEADEEIPSVFLDSEAEDDNCGNVVSTKREKGKRKRSDNSEADDNCGNVVSTKREKGKRKRSDSQKKREVLQRKKLRKIESLKKQNAKNLNYLRN